MRIAIVLPGIPTHATGGTKIVLEYANRLASANSNYDIELLFLSNPKTGRMAKIPIPLFIKYTINIMRAWINPKWFKLNRRIRKRTIFSINDKSVRDGDWVLATAATTASGVYRLAPTKGKKGYIIQDFETWDMPVEQLENTYRYGMKNLVISHWLKDKVEAITGKECVCIPNPVDTEVFHPVDTFKRDQKTVALLYHPGAHKGFKFAWRAILLAREYVPDLHVNMFGTYPPPQDLPNWVSYTRNADNNDLVRIYNTSEVFVCASVNEGYGLTCLEAMACGCALVITDFAGSREYARADKNAIVVPVGDVQSIADGIVRLLKDSDLRNSLGKTGIDTARSLSWESAVNQFELYLGMHCC